MANRSYLLTLLVVALLLSPVSSLAQGTGSLLAGAAKVDITPDPSELAFSTDSIRGKLYVRAIVVDDGEACAALVTIDAGGARDNVVDAAIAESSASTGCPAENYVISATHTHSGSTGGLGGAGSPTAETITAAIVSAVDAAKTRLAPARVGYGTAQLDLNVNRDLFNSKQEWRQEPNPDGPSDKTLAVVAFVGEDAVPIGVLMNYAMHPINFYLSGVVSADFPGDASRYVEELFDDQTVALFSQGASGDQNPRLGYTAPYSTRSFRRGLPPAPLTVGPEPPRPENSTQQGFNPQAASAGRGAIPPEQIEVYKKVIGRVSDYVTMLGHMIGSTSVRVMREDMQYANTAAIWSGQDVFSCPGRTRLDLDNPARENVFPGYEDGPDVNIKVGLLRIGDIHLVSVNGEVYTNISLKLKETAPANKTIMVTLANGRANSGYIYSDESGPGVRMSTQEMAAATTAHVLKELGIAPNDWRKLLDVPAADLLALQSTIAPVPPALRKSVITSDDPPIGFGPVVDGVVLPGNPFDPTATEISRDKPLITGWNEDEYTFFAWQRRDTGFTEIDFAGLHEKLEPDYGADTAKIVETYRRAMPEASAPEIFVAVASINMMGLGSVEIAEKKAMQGGAPVYLYNFGYKSEMTIPGSDYPLGTPHAMDIAFKFNNVVPPKEGEEARPSGFGGNRPERFAASRYFAELWTTFARTGKPAAEGAPDWPAYNLADRPTMQIDSTCEVINDRFSEELALWRSIGRL